MSHADLSCAVCLSPLGTVRGASSGHPDPMGVVRESYVTPCNHWFHKCCIQSCRASDLKGCPLCREALPAGLTPPLVRQQRLAAAAASSQHDEQVTQMRDLMINRANAARDAVRRAQQQSARAAEAVDPAVVPSQPPYTAPTTQLPPPAPPLSPPPFRSALEVVGMHHTASHDMAQLLGESPLPAGAATSADASSDSTSAAPPCFHCTSGVSCGECVGCSEAFCQLCSTLNYQLREERLFCLSCRPRAAPASLIPQPELVGIVENI